MPYGVLPDTRRDGRLAVGRGGERLPRAVTMSAVALALVFIVVGLLAWAGASIGAQFAQDADVVLTTTAAALLMPAAVFFLLRGRHESRQASLGMATGTLTLAIVTLGSAELAPLLASGTPGAADEIRAWSVLGALVAFALGLSEVGSERDSSRLMGFSASFILLAVVSSLAPSQELAPVDALVVAAWLAVVGAHAFAFVRTGQVHRAWIVLGLFGLMLGDVARLAPAHPELWAIAAGLLRIMGVLMMLAGLVGDLELRHWRQRQELDSSEALMAELRAMTDAAQRALEERDHEARSALAAIEYTAHALQRRGASLQRPEIEQLEAAMLAEVALLRRLVTLTDAPSELEPFGVAAALRGIVAATVATGLEVELEVPPELAGMGMPAATAEIVQCLLENARHHAPGSPVYVTAARRGPYVIIQVDDDGPGVPADRRRAIFKRGQDGGQPTSASGRGLGLYIAARLAREQRGHLWVQEAASGGASFRLALGAAQGAVGATSAGVPAASKAGDSRRGVRGG